MQNNGNRIGSVDKRQEGIHQLSQELYILNGQSKQRGRESQKWKCAKNGMVPHTSFSAISKIGDHPLISLRLFPLL